MNEDDWMLLLVDTQLQTKNSGCPLTTKTKAHDQKKSEHNNNNAKSPFTSSSSCNASLFVSVFECIFFFYFFTFSNADKISNKSARIKSKL